MKSGEQFERTVAGLYRRLGARVEHNAHVGGLQIDVYAVFTQRDRGKHRVVIETKDWSRPVGPRPTAVFAREVVRPLRLAGKIEEGVIVSARGFTKDARDAGKTHGIRLLEIEELESLATDVVPGAPPLVMLIPTLPTPHIAHPYALQMHFTGRDEQRRMLTSWLVQETAPLFLLVGPGGTGKTALSWVWFMWDVLGYQGALAANLPRRRPSEGFALDGTFWWSFYDEDARFASFLDKALVYASSGHVAPHEITSSEEKVRVLLGLLQRHRFLFVLDGLERELQGYRDSTAVAHQLDDSIKDEFRTCSDRHAADFLARVASTPTLSSRVLLVSRHRPRELDGLANVGEMQLGGLEPADALGFLKAHGVRGEDQLLLAACSVYANDPFALQILAGVIMDDPSQPGEIQVAERSAIVRDLRGRARHHILHVAYESLPPPDQELLRRVSAFCTPLAYAELSVLNRHSSRDGFDRALRRLADRALLWHDRQRKRYGQHPIVRAFFYDTLLQAGRAARGDTEVFQAIPDEILAGEIREDMRALFTLPAGGEALEYAHGLKEEDLAPIIELYRELVDAKQHDIARALFRDRLADLLYYRFAAYEKCITLLRGLMSSDPTRDPVVLMPHAQAWTLHMLGNCLMQVGRPREAADAYRRANEISGLINDWRSKAQNTVNLAYQRFSLGELLEAERLFRESIVLCREISEAVAEAEARQELARLLVYCGRPEEANLEFESAQHIYDDLETPAQESEGVGLTYLALYKLAMGEGGQAYRVAEQGRSKVQLESNVIWSQWVLGEVLRALESSGSAADGNADRHLTEALARCRQIRCVEIERYILISCARLQYRRGELAMASEYADDALALGERAEYRLEQADAHNIIARVALSREKRQEARQHAEKARERARCDGPGHCYQAALTEAETILAELDDEQTGP